MSNDFNLLVELKLSSAVKFLGFNAKKSLLFVAYLSYTNDDQIVYQWTVDGDGENEFNRLINDYLSGASSMGSSLNDYLKVVRKAAGGNDIDTSIVRELSSLLLDGQSKVIQENEWSGSYKSTVDSIPKEDFSKTQYKNIQEAIKKTFKPEFVKNLTSSPFNW